MRLDGDDDMLGCTQGPKQGRVPCRHHSQLQPSASALLQQNKTAPPPPTCPHFIPSPSKRTARTTRSRTSCCRSRCASAARTASGGSTTTQPPPRRRRRAHRASLRATGGRPSPTTRRPQGREDEASEEDEATATTALRVEKEEADVLVCPPRTFRWQEKRFGPMEVRAIRKELDDSKPKRRESMMNLLSRSSGSSLGDVLMGRHASTSALGSLSNHHREVFQKLDAEAQERGDEYSGDILFSRVHSENYVLQGTLSKKLTDSAHEVTTPLAKNVLSGVFTRQHRDMLGEAASVTMHIFAALPSDEVEEALGGPAAAPSAATPGTPRSTSRKPGELGRSRSSFFGSRGDDDDDKEEKLSEVPLCLLRLYPGGRLDMKPALSFDRLAADEGAVLDPERIAKWYAIPGTRYEYMLTNLAEGTGKSLEAAAERMAKLRLASQAAVPRPPCPT